MSGPDDWRGIRPPSPRDVAPRRSGQRDLALFVGFFATVALAFSLVGVAFEAKSWTFARLCLAVGGLLLVAAGAALASRRLRRREDRRSRWLEGFSLGVAIGIATIATVTLVIGGCITLLIHANDPSPSPAARVDSARARDMPPRHAPPLPFDTGRAVLPVPGR